MPNKKALLVGCNYPGSSAELKGCINDVYSMQEMLTSLLGFQPNDITIMIDTDSSTTQPTGKNIKAGLKALVDAAQDGDELFFHFSGHGTQVPSPDPAEIDGKDEAICPCDMNIICDNDLRDILSPLKNKGNVKLTFVADCCHSGTILDHDEVIITGPKPGGPAPPDLNVQGMLAALAGGNKEMTNRSLPFSGLCSVLFSMLEKMGLQLPPALTGNGAGTKAMDKAAGAMGISAENIHQVLLLLFGQDASSVSSGYGKYLGMGLKMLAGYLAPKPAPGSPEAAALAAEEANKPSMLAGLFKSCFGGGTEPSPGSQYMTTDTPGDGGAQFQSKPPTNSLDPDIGILITGCQDKETSADARPPGGKAHGALTNALVTVAKAHYQQMSGQPLTNRNLVIGVREALAKTGFTQNPCLECSGKWADSPFVLQ